MAEKKTSIHGLSIVDATTNDNPSVDDVKKVNDDDVIVKIEGESESGAQHDDRCEELLDENSFFKEAEEKLNLFDILDEKDENGKGDKNPGHNSTLIITTEEHLDTTTCDDTLNSETVKNVKKDSIKTAPNLEENKKKSRNAEQGYFWVSNIDRHVKATILKKFFSPMGKVLTAKILTNGKNYFGYVSVDSTETAAKCIKQLNNTFFEGKKVIVSKERPDLRDSRSAVRAEPRRKRAEKLEAKEKKSTESKDTAPEKPKSNKAPEKGDKTNEAIVELNTKLEKSKAETDRYKFKLLEYQRRHDGMRKKCESLEKELKEMQYQIRTDRRRLNQDKEQFEKTKKLEQIRLEADKVLVSKELDEVKKLREHLKSKIDEASAQPKKTCKRRDVRSPLPVERSRTPPRTRSPVMRIGARVTYRSDDRLEKKRKREEPPHGRTPPPPPKLTNGVVKKRSDNLPHRQFFEGFDKRSSTLDRGHGFEYRHKTSFPTSQDVSRTSWPASYPKDPRRLNTVPSSTLSYPSEQPRYGGSYQFPQSTITVPPRSYYPEFSKPYGHY